MKIDELDFVEKYLEERAGGEASAEKPRLKTREVIGEWRVEAFVGAGLSAEVYRVINTRYGQQGALKLLKDRTRGLEERFLTEAEAIRNLSLKVLPRFMDSGEYKSFPYYVMEYLLPLPDPMPRREIPGFLKQLLKAVHALHEAGYVHRDLKPANVLTRINGEPVIIDLGLIKRRDATTVDRIVRHGRNFSIIGGKLVGVGTHEFSAPEQLLRADFSVQSDIYSLGKIARYLYEGKVPRLIRPIIEKATKENAADRYESAKKMSRAISRRFIPSLRSSAIFAAFIVIVAALLAFHPALFPPPAPPKPPVSFIEQEISLAEAYFYGREGKEQDLKEAVKHYTLAAEAGSDLAQDSLGYCYLRGFGCEQSDEKAAQYFALAAEQGNLASMSNLAYCYLNGKGVKPNRRYGFQLALKAARKGHVASQRMVGECYMIGLGVDRDEKAGSVWLDLAAGQGDKRALKITEQE